MAGILSTELGDLGFHFLGKGLGANQRLRSREEIESFLRLVGNEIKSESVESPIVVRSCEFEYELMGYSGVLITESAIASFRGCDIPGSFFFSLNSVVGFSCKDLSDIVIGFFRPENFVYEAR